MGRCFSSNYLLLVERAGVLLVTTGSLLLGAEVVPLVVVVFAWSTLAVAVALVAGVQVATVLALHLATWAGVHLAISAVVQLAGWQAGEGWHLAWALMAAVPINKKKARLKSRNV